MSILDRSPGRTAIIDGKEHLFFSGYSYLGMSHLTEFVELVKEGIDKYGILFPSSRISNTRLGIFETMEAFLSELTFQEETVIYSSGFLAGRAVVDLLYKIGAKCFAAPATHAAIGVTAKQLIEDWQQHFIELTEKTSYDEFVLLSDSLNPLTATINDFSFLKSISSNKKITCVIDDSHGIGLLGEKGEGISALLPKLSNIEYVLTYSLAKAFHINGGAISCGKIFSERLRQSPFYTASTSVSPSLCYALIKGQNLYSKQRKKLQRNLTYFQELVNQSQHISFHSQLPIFILTNDFDQDYFTPHNIIISSFPYPNPSGKKINRVVLSAPHTKEDMETIASVVKKKNGGQLLSS
jgi:7-keto-8-aminopelargonate synthetase-like enzyme